MTYIPANEDSRKAMLDALGVDSVDALWSTIPESLLLEETLDLPERLSEMETRRRVESLAAKNRGAAELVCFLGAGAYDHYVPSTVNHVILRSEWYTAYTPYQPEVAQGTLQAVYEYQTMICELTGMEVANASVYDASSAVAEAALMADSISRHKRSKRVVSQGVNPAYRSVLRTYGSGQGLETVVTPLTADGATDVEAVAAALDEETSVVIIQSPNFFGVIEDQSAVIGAAHEAGALVVVVADPHSLGLLVPPGAHGADIVVGEGQALGNALSLGGPYFGFLAARKKFIRQMPGRIMGRSEDLNGQSAYVMVLQTREQHIRREKATSNICTNQGLNALAATVYMATLGKTGFRQAAEHSFATAHYAARKIAALPGYDLRFASPFFKEFAITTPAPPSEIVDRGRDAGLLCGLAGDRYPLADALDGIDMGRLLLIAATEQRTREEVDRLVGHLAEFT